MAHSTYTATTVTPVTPVAQAGNPSLLEATPTPMSQTETITPPGHLPYSKERDLEAGQPGATDEYDIDENTNASKDPNFVTWDGPKDPENPKNWPNKKKWTYTIAVSLFVFISPVSSAMIAPAMENLGASLGMHSEFEIYLSLAIFILAYAVGPIFFGPASELYGRVRLLQLSNVWYLAWNLGCGFATTKSQFFAFRFLAGIGGSAPLALGGGAIR